MNEQEFINVYIRLLSQSLTEQTNKNLVLQAQLEVANQTAAKVGELENKLKEYSDASFDSSGLVAKIKQLQVLLDEANTMAATKAAHVETFKRELIGARETIKKQMTEIEFLKSRKRKKETTLNTETVIEQSVPPPEPTVVSDTF